MAQYSYDALRKSLSETMEWCSSRVPTPEASRVLRSAELAPPTDFVDWEPPDLPFDYRAGTIELFRRQRIIFNHRQHAVKNLGSTRSQILTQNGGKAQSAAHPGGRILIIDFSGNTYDGLAEGHTDGFFDVYNLPPWDTWFWYDEYPWGDIKKGSFGEMLLCWIPASCVELADRGVRCNAECCIVWAEWTLLELFHGLGESKAVSDLRGAGIIDCSGVTFSALRGTNAHK